MCRYVGPHHPQEKFDLKNKSPQGLKRNDERSINGRFKGHNVKFYSETFTWFLRVLCQHLTIPIFGGTDKELQRMTEMWSSNFPKDDWTSSETNVWLRTTLTTPASTCSFPLSPRVIWWLFNNKKISASAQFDSHALSEWLSLGLPGRGVTEVGT